MHSDSENWLRTHTDIPSRPFSRCGLFLISFLVSVGFNVSGTISMLFVGFCSLHSPFDRRRCWLPKLQCITNICSILRPVTVHAVCTTVCHQLIAIYPIKSIFANISARFSTVNRLNYLPTHTPTSQIIAYAHSFIIYSRIFVNVFFLSGYIAIASSIIV